VKLVTGHRCCSSDLSHSHGDAVAGDELTLAAARGHDEPLGSQVAGGSRRGDAQE